MLTYVKYSTLTFGSDPIETFFHSAFVFLQGSVVIIVYNQSTDSLLFVRQFRPAVHVMLSKEQQGVSSIHNVDFTRQQPKLAVTYEFCAGIIDKKHLSNKEHAHAELLEECGFAVDINSIESVTSYRSGVGTAGSVQELFYVEVTNEMKRTSGGGNVSEQERKRRSASMVDLTSSSFLCSDCRPGNSGWSIVSIFIRHNQGKRAYNDVWCYVVSSQERTIAISREQNGKDAVLWKTNRHEICFTREERRQCPAWLKLLIGSHPTLRGI